MSRRRWSEKYWRRSGRRRGCALARSQGFLSYRALQDGVKFTARSERSCGTVWSSAPLLDCAATFGAVRSDLPPAQSETAPLATSEALRTPRCERSTAPSRCRGSTAPSLAELHPTSIWGPLMRSKPQAHASLFCSAKDFQPFSCSTPIAEGARIPTLTRRMLWRPNMLTLPSSRSSTRMMPRRRPSLPQKSSYRGHFTLCARRSRQSTRSESMCRIV